MIITKQQLAVNLLNYLQHKTNLNDLVLWAENAFMEGDIQGEDPDVVRDITTLGTIFRTKNFIEQLAFIEKIYPLASKALQ